MNEGKTLGRAKRTLICLLVTAVVGFVYFYLELPAINLHAPDFYVFAFLLSVTPFLRRGAFSALWRRSRSALGGSATSSCAS